MGRRCAVGITVVGIPPLTLPEGLGITLSPNPAANQLYITGNWQSQTAKASLTIFNTLGQEIYNRQLQASNFKQETVIDVSSFSPNIYFVQVTTEQGRWMGKFVKE